MCVCVCGGGDGGGGVGGGGRRREGEFIHDIHVMIDPLNHNPGEKGIIKRQYLCFYLH